MKLSKGVVEEGGLYETDATNDIDDIDDDSVVGCIEFDLCGIAG